MQITIISLFNTFQKGMESSLRFIICHIILHLGYPLIIILHPVNGFSELLVAFVPCVCRVLAFLTIFLLKL